MLISFRGAIYYATAMLRRLKNAAQEANSSNDRRLDEMSNRLDVVCHTTKDIKRKVKAVNMEELEERKRAEYKELGELLKDFKEETKEVKQAIPQQEKQGKEMMMDWVEVVKKGRGRRSGGPRVVIEFPKEGERKKRSDLIECLDKKGGEVRVKSIRRQGKNMVVEVHSEEDIGKLRESEKIKAAGFKVDGKPKLRKPRILIRGVEKDSKKKHWLKQLRVEMGKFLKVLQRGERKMYL